MAILFQNQPLSAADSDFNTIHERPSMLIGNPEDLKKIEGFTRLYAESCRQKCLNHKSFIGPGDRFEFACKRTGVCCKNFTSNDRIIIEPYDVLRLCRKLKISTGRFMKVYADLILDDNIHFPIALLKYKGNSARNKCHFLRSYGCSIYEDRPLRCRLYPLGRILHDGKSYFIHINNCSCEESDAYAAWSAQEWIDNSNAEEYLEYQGYISEVYSYADWETFRNLDIDKKLALGETLYHIHEFPETIPVISRPVSDKEIMSSLKYRVEEFLIENGCLKPEYKTGNMIKSLSIQESKKEVAGLNETAAITGRPIPTPV